MIAISDKISVPRDIINSVEDIRNVYPNFKEVSLSIVLETVIEMQLEW